MQKLEEISPKTKWGQGTTVEFRVEDYRKFEIPVSYLNGEERTIGGSDCTIGLYKEVGREWGSLEMGGGDTFKKSMGQMIVVRCLGEKYVRELYKSYEPYLKPLEEVRRILAGEIPEQEALSKDIVELRRRETR